ncbi:dTDP-glucose 4,6-dehydratase [Pseudonocardia alni]|uniref:dTDP-glucose 4,6-dehydratase n=1 Tax=Pseudonocardia alni TaxID=33907 RepID=UPI0033C3E638|nr:AntB2 [Pseudonocardia antarctica]
MTTVLVTGAAGFIGSNFVRYWRRIHSADRIVALDLLTYAGVRSNIEAISDVEFVHGSIADAPLVCDLLRRHGVDVIVNFAAESHNSLAVLRPGDFFDTNVVGTQRLLESARTVGVGRFHHISTCEVYGDLPLDADASAAFTEASPYRPQTPYNASKAGADHAVRAYSETYDLPVTITNCANNYGPFQFPEKVIPLFTTRALDGRPLPLYSSAANRREWLHVDDHAAAIDVVLHHGVTGETYNVGSGTEVDVTGVADAVLAALGLGPDLKTTVPDRPGHDRRYLLDSGRLRRELGWRPRVAWSEGIVDTVEWYRRHPDWWRPLLGRAPVVEGAEAVWDREPPTAAASS